MRVDEAHDQQERLLGGLVAGAPADVAILEPGDRAVGVDRVADESRQTTFSAVGFGPAEFATAVTRPLPEAPLAFRGAGRPHPMLPAG